MEFSTEEMARRLRSTRDELERADLDCLLVTSPENFCYFSGAPVNLYQQRRPWCAIIPRDEEPTALMMAGTEAALAGSSYITNVESYRLPVSGNLPARIADVLKRDRLKRVACEFGLEQRLGMPPADFCAVMANLPETEFVDGAALIWKLRMFKSPEETSRIKRACEITATTRHELWKNIEEGMTEREIAANWGRLMVDAGAERPAFIFVDSDGSGDFLPKRDKKVKRGDTLWLDGGAYVDGYTCDYNRIATLGPASTRQRQLHRDVTEIMTHILAEVAPGVRVADLARSCSRELTERGYPTDEATSVAGHGLGMITNEPPLIATWDETILQEGLVTTIEFGPVDPAGMFVWEEMIQITADGYDLLSHEPIDLVEIAST